MFVRGFKGVEKLKNTKLFKEYLYPDIVNNFFNKDKNRDVFPAVRKNRLDFYSNGGKLFSFDEKNGFSTHAKYASVFSNMHGNAVTEEQLLTMKPIEHFFAGYESIKENCGLYSGIEAEGVSRLYNKYSCAKHKVNSEIVVLDIEISFKSEDEDRSQDRIDLLLFNTETGELKFCEAKAFYNSEIRAENKKEIKVVEQINRYRSHLNTKEKREQIVEQYRNHIKVINALSSPEEALREPTHIDDEPCLFIFGFDDDQKKGRLKGNLDDLRKAGVKKIYTKGDVRSTEITALWKAAI